MLMMAERLGRTRHPATQLITARAQEVKEERGRLVGMVEERQALMQLSVTFHEKQEQVNIPPYFSPSSSSSSPLSTYLGVPLYI